MLDVLDKKILRELDINSRQSFNHIAKKVGSSKEVVRYRFEQLKNKNIITNCNALINTYKLGYLIHIIWIKFQNTTKEKEREIIKFLINSNRVGVTLEIYGMWDLVFGIWAKDTIEFKKYFDEITASFSEYIREYAITIELNCTYLSQESIYEKKIPEVTIGNNLESKNIDEVDTQIIRMLAIDSRTPIIDISKKTNLKANAVAARIKNLEKNGIIASYKVTLNYEELNLMHYRIFLKVTKNYEKKIMNYLKTTKKVISVMNYIGLGDIEFRLCVKNVKELNEELSELKRSFGTAIQNYDSILFMKSFEVLNFLPI
jgi:Lrp/AsnC family transcriptional regulator